MIKAVVLTVSDSCAIGQRDDVSGQTIVDILKQSTFDVCEKKIVADETQTITTELIRFSDKGEVDVVFTTGGTGLGPRDVTPEATIAVCERMAPGLAELMRLKGLEKTPNAVLSRAAAGIRKETLIMNLPGSPNAARECLQAILDILPHAVKMMHGGGH